MRRIKPLLESLKLVPIAQTHREAEVARSRLVSLRAAEHRLKHLRDEGTITLAAYSKLASKYSGQQGALEEKLRVLYEQDPDLTKSEITMGQQEALFDLNRRGVTSDDVYRELTTEIDVELHQLIQTPAQHRASESGPEAPVEVEESGEGSLNIP